MLREHLFVFFQSFLCAPLRPPAQSVEVAPEDDTGGMEEATIAIEAKVSQALLSGCGVEAVVGGGAVRGRSLVVGGLYKNKEKRKMLRKPRKTQDAKNTHKTKIKTNPPPSFFFFWGGGGACRAPKRRARGMF